MTLCAASQFRGESYRVRHVLMQEGWPLKKRARFRYPDCSNPFDETQLSRLSSGGGGYDRTGGRPADVGAVAILWGGDGPYKFDASFGSFRKNAVLLIVRCVSIAEHPFSWQADIQTFCSPIYGEEIIEIDNGMFAHEIRDQYLEPFVSSF